MEEKNGQPVLAMRLETKKLIAELSSDSHKVGDTITDERLKEVCGANCRPQERGYGYLSTAIKNVTREHRRHWKRLPGGGAIKWLTAQEAIEAARRDREHIGRTARYSVRKLQTVDASSLAPAEATEFNASIAQMGTLAVFSSGHAAKALEARKATSPVELPKLLEAMK